MTDTLQAGDAGVVIMEAEEKQLERLEVAVDEALEAFEKIEPKDAQYWEAAAGLGQLVRARDSLAERLDLAPLRALQVASFHQHAELGDLQLLVLQAQALAAGLIRRTDGGADAAPSLVRVSPEEAAEISRIVRERGPGGGR